jgi:hypothetical protein
MIQFDQETHTYNLNGERLPSVTQILKPLYDFSAVPPDVLRRAAEFGTAVHKAVELYLKDDLDEQSLDPALVGPLTAFKVFLMDHPALAEQQPIIEIPIYHKRLKYAGTPDLVYPYDDIDIKSRPFSESTDPLQLAAYGAAVEDFHFRCKAKRGAWVLELKQDGTYTFTNAVRKDAFKKFRYLLDYYKMGEEIARWRK